jgi:G3E family GTPase
MTTRLVPYTVIGGYLGAGKTTVLNELLRVNHGMRLAVIVNDFGDIGIDADLIVGQDGDTINLANGCICCSLSDGLATVLAGLAGRAEELDHVVVEASGVSDPVRIGHYGRPFGFELRGVIVLADAEQVRRRAVDKYVGDTVINQLRGADLLVLTKADLVDTEQFADVRGWLGEISPRTPILDAAMGRVSTAIVLGDIEPSTDTASEVHDVHALDYDTWSHVDARPIWRRSIERFVEALPEGVLRVKGVIRLADDADHQYILQVVGRRSTLVRGERWADTEQPRTRLVVIAVPGSLDRDQLTRAMSLESHTQQQTDAHKET